MEDWVFPERSCISDKDELCYIIVISINYGYIKFLSCRANEASKKLPPEECFQLLAQAQAVLRKEYIQKQYRAREEINKRSDKC